MELLPHVWNNLVGNAIKYTPNGGHIRVSLQRQGDTAVFTVADDGIGMSDEVRSHIFDRYYQADSGPHPPGHRPGLPIVHSIVSLCGGRIQVESTPGAGSTLPRPLARRRDNGGRRGITPAAFTEIGA